mmetsp:Transcript_3166/g.5892  ORF Transcript_3166/g.5892 Transcript_3166/m.5892 type:complete len:192 (-) Transcript_3166:566-1141(-)
MLEATGDTVELHGAVVVVAVNEERKAEEEDSSKVSLVATRTIMVEGAAEGGGRDPLKIFRAEEPATDRDRSMQPHIRLTGTRISTLEGMAITVSDISKCLVTETTLNRLVILSLNKQCHSNLAVRSNKQCWPLRCKAFLYSKLGLEWEEEEWAGFQIRWAVRSRRCTDIHLQCFHNPGLGAKAVEGLEDMD